VTLVSGTSPAHESFDVRRIVDAIGDARVVLIGEASHGTHEFYALRAKITQHLIEEHGFTGVAAEADWPDAWRVNRYVRGQGDDGDAERALAGFVRFPSWMWRNAVVRDFTEWLRARNAGVDAHRRAGFYGLDVYSLRSSVDAVLGYLKDVDSDGYRLALERYSCLDHTGSDGQRYGHGVTFGLSRSCEDDVVRQLVDLRTRAADYAARDGGGDAYFSAEQNARVVAGAEAYYRTMFGSSVASWNLRDTHMGDTLDALIDHLGHQTDDPKVVVWAHNSHVGDARATQMGASGEINIGQLARERHPGRTAIVGFTTYTGTVTAASDWGAETERKRVRPALDGSYEHLLQARGHSAFWLDLRGSAGDRLRAPLLERAIGVIYRPQTERTSHYFRARLPDQFDIVVHLDETHALEPLERTSVWDEGEPPETYPWAV
jgi:erythromycin esterase-like protein